MHSLMHTYVNAYNEFESVNVTMSIRAISVVYRKIGTIYLYNITLCRIYIHTYTQLLLYTEERLKQCSCITSLNDAYNVFCRSIGNALYGLRSITSDTDGVRELCSALSSKIDQVMNSSMNRCMYEWIHGWMD
jgi:hypothetical protein